MSLRHAVLGLLANAPSTGYELTRRFDSSLAHAWHASHSQVYPLLARLEADGLIEVVGEGARRSRTWAATDAGRAELRRWLLETDPDRSQRSESGVRWFLQELLDPADRREVLERELAYARRSREELLQLSERVRAAERAGQRGFGGSVDLGLRIQAATIEWIEDQLAELGGHRERRGGRPPS